MTTEAIYWSAVRGKYLLEISLLMTTEAFPLLVPIGASLSEPHTSVTALRTRVSVYPSMDRPLTGNFK